MTAALLDGGPPPHHQARTPTRSNLPNRLQEEPLERPTAAESLEPLEEPLERPAAEEPLHASSQSLEPLEEPLERPTAEEPLDASSQLLDETLERPSAAAGVAGTAVCCCWRSRWNGRRLEEPLKLLEGPTADAAQLLEEPLERPTDGAPSSPQPRGARMP